LPFRANSSSNVFPTRHKLKTGTRDNKSDQIDALQDAREDYEPEGDLKNYHPDNCLFSNYRRRMWYAYQTDGPNGLAHYLYGYARKRVSKGEKQYRYFTEDRDRVLPFLISTMHSELVRSLIKGDLAYRYHTNTSFRASIDRTTRLESTPGIYLNVFKNNGTATASATQKEKSPTPTNNLGRGFSACHFDLIASCVSRYLDESRYAQQIETVIVTSDQVDHTNNPDFRLYRKTANGEKVIRAWRDKVVKRLEKAREFKNTPL
jgi:hypothetical protein